jgi:hypothetical protein
MELADWYESHRGIDGRDPDRYVVCAGLAVLELMRTKYPLSHDDYITPKNQVRTSGSLVQRVLARHGEMRQYASEGGRTTRGTRIAAEALVSRLNTVDELQSADDQERHRLIGTMQAWLADRVKEYFERQKIEIDLVLDKPSAQIIYDIMEAADSRNQMGPVIQHLVGAKLALRFPHREIENHSYTTADTQLGRPGDFVVEDTVFHVTASPSEPLIGKCGDNLRNGYRVAVLVPERRLLAARQLAELRDMDVKIGVGAVEAFVGQNIDEIGEFGKGAISKGFRSLLEEYNRRVAAVEADRSLLIDIPENL